MRGGGGDACVDDVCLVLRLIAPKKERINRAFTCWAWQDNKGEGLDSLGT
jgi:hypothetical protein